MATWYCGSTKHTAVAQWAANTAYGAGSIVRQLDAPTVGNERCFRTALGGTSHATTEPVWVLTKGAAQPADGTITDWLEVTGDSAYGWTAPHARIYVTLSWAAAGDTLWVSNNHAETTVVSTTHTSPGTASNPCYILCVNDTATPPTTLATTATLTIGTNCSFADFAYCYGISFISSYNNVGAIQFTSSLPWWWKLDACNLSLSAVGTSARMRWGAVQTGAHDNQLLELVNTTCTFGNAAQGIIPRCRIRWSNKSNSDAILGTSPTTLFLPENVLIFDLECSGLDLTGVATNLINAAPVTIGSAKFRNCSLPAAINVITGTIPGQGGIDVTLDNCDSGDTNYRNEWYRYQGSTITETTIKRTGGASDGTTAYCRKMVALATGPTFVSPLESPAILRWNDAVGSAITATVEIMHDSLTNLQDDEVWIEVEYLGTSGFPLASMISDRMTNILSTPADQAAGTGAGNWTTTGLTNPNSQKLHVSFTPQEKGLLSAKVMLAKASYTVYYDPVITVT